MREIKFRSWDKNRKKIYCVRSIEFVYNSSEIKLINDYEFGNDYDHEQIRSNYELMQYTGLKDKVGVEIYEGDIIKSRTNKTSNLIVEWMDKYARFILKGKSYEYKKTFHNTLGLARKSEVIGNIYENPELLEE